MVTQVLVFPVGYFGKAESSGAVTGGNVAEAASFEKIEKISGVNDPETIYDLIAVVVDSEVDKDLTSYPGLREKYPSDLEAGTVGERIVRYAEDLREDNELTDVRVIIFDKNKDSVTDLAAALENLYINGDGTHVNRLAGVVLVGDIPLPVVNKEGNRFVSMFPYTDFENKAYIYDSATGSFERNADVSFPKPEIWHGVMRTLGAGQAGMEKLAQYLDKNHLYYAGVPEYANFEKKLFFADLVHEEENMNEEIYKQYLKYLESWEDLAYMRYNKFWAKELTDEMNKTVASIANKPDAGGYGDILSGDPLSNLPDIQSKQIIDQFLPPYYKIFGSYLSKINDFVENTARYGSQDFDSVPVLISIKDEYTKQYLKKANEALEKQVNKVVAKIEEPLDLLEYAVLSGNFSSSDGVKTNFAVEASGQLPQQLALTKQTDKIYFKYHYLNENTKDFYINGVDADLIASAKQCSVYLGSTKTEYYDENLNFNPKANVDGVYSILTRALRSDSTLTSSALPTAGVNTRLLGPKEAYTATNGKVSSGEVVEDNVEYGISAFLDNPVVGGNYLNPWSKYLAKGDVIYKVNGKVLAPDYTFAVAMDEAYKLVKRVITATNNGQIAKLDNFPYKIELADNFGLDSGKIERAAGLIGIDYYHGGEKKTANLSFSVDKEGKTSTGKPSFEGETGPRAALIMTENYAGFNFETSTDGAIFTLYDLKQGFSGRGYDNSAGCNLASAGKNSDRCFWWLASMPVLDPAGALMPVKTIDPGKEPELKFTEDFGKDESGKNNPAAFAKHTDVLQFPGGGKDDHYKFEDMDEVYYDSCYFGLPGVVDNENLASDSNPYGFVLDPAAGDSYDILGKDGYFLDFAGRILRGVGNFVASSGGDNKLAPDKSAILADIAELDAGDIVLNNLNGPEVVTLKDFSNKWGLFDGVDNDKDGLTDFEWRDIYLPDGVTKGQDGVYETKWYDFDEAGSDYAIPAENLNEIARKMLSHKTSYTLPAIAEISPFAEDITLNVGVKNYASNGNAPKKISSMVLHNEPTEHTIFEQVKSQSAFSLPIDNPRYVAFQSKSALLPKYPTPVPVASNPPIDVEVILAKLNTDPYYFPGKTVRVDYPNLFKTPNYAQLKSDLDTLAWKITEAYGSYKILNANDPVNCSAVLTLEQSAKCKAIHDEILKKYLEPVVNGILDSPVDGFELDAASGEKIVDAFYWRDMNIDQKHDYILKYYLDDFRNAFVGDQTVFPANFGYNIKNGYEAMYLVLDGEKDHFDLGFNKDLPVEENKQFDPLALISASDDGAGGFVDGLGEDGFGGGGAAGGDEESSSGAGEEDEFEFVDLSQFLKELKDFVSFFTTEPSFEKSCAYAEAAKDETAAKAAGVDDKAVDFGDGEDLVDVMEESSSSGVGDEFSGSVQINTYIATNPDVPVLSAAEVLEISAGELGDFGELSTLKDEESVSSQLIDNALKILDKEALKKAADESDALGKEVDDLLKSIPGDTFETEDGGGELAPEESETEGQADAGEDSDGMQGLDEQKDAGEESEIGDGQSDVSDGMSGQYSDDLGDTSGGELPDFGQSIDTFVDENGDIIILKSELLTWPEYFINKTYWEKFITDFEISAFGEKLLSSRPMAAIFSDQNPFEDEGKIVELGNEIVADGESIMKISAVVFDQNNNVDNTPRKIKFSLVGGEFPDMATFVNGPEVTSLNGEAVVYLKAGKKAGSVKIRAEVLDGLKPIGEKEISLIPGPVAAISIEASSDVLVANGQSKTNLTITLRDKFGNRATNSFAKIGIFADGPGYVDASFDSDNTIVGTQIGTFEGFAKVDLFAKDVSGELNVVALLFDDALNEKFLDVGDDWQEIDFAEYVGNFKKIAVLNDVDLRLTFDKKTLLADGNDIVKLKTELVSNGTVLSGYNGPIKFQIVDKSLGTFVNAPPKEMVNGVLHEANLPIKSTQIAGEIEVLAEIPGFVSASQKIKSTSGKAFSIELTASDDVLYTDGKNQVVLKARLIDANGNPVETDNSTSVSFSSTAATSSFVKFAGAQSALALNGTASVIILGNDLSGVANIIASAPGIKNTTISLKVVKRTKGTDLADIKPRALYASVLGGDFGNVISKENLAENLLNNIGQVQAVSSVTASVDENKKLFYVDGFGKIDIFSEGISGEVLAANDSFPYQKVVFKDQASGEVVAEAFMVLNNGNKVYLSDFSDVDNANGGAGVFVKKLSLEDKQLEFIGGGGEDVEIKKGGKVLAKIDNFGRISLSDDKVKLRLIDEEDAISVGNLAFVLENSGMPIALVSFKQSFKDINGAVKNAMTASDEINSFYPGIYLRQKTNSKRYELLSGLSGTSSNDPLGMYFVDKENKIEDEMAPGFSFRSLESAKDNFGVGFTGENKHMLLFAAGNSVGESNMPYASDAGIVFGDPNVRVKIKGIVGLVSELSGYSKDLGKPLFYGEEEVSQMINFDYNADGYDDILLIYEDGLVRLLQNEISRKRFRDQGYVLNIPLGVITATKIDVNNDGYSDLVVGTKESCKKDEICVSLYTNKNGTLTRETLNLAIEGKAYEMKSGDLNNDGCEDLVISDSASNIRTFYNKSDGKNCLGLSTNHGSSVNFGLKVDSTMNLKDNLFVSYSGMPQINSSYDPALDNSADFVKFVLRISGNGGNEFATSGTDFQAGILNNPNIAGKDIPPQTYPQEFNFVNLAKDARFGTESFKKAVDLNGGSVNAGDEIEYVITLKNGGQSAVNNLRLSDATPPSMTLILDSLACMDNGCKDDLQWTETGMSLRSHVISNINIPAGGVRTIRYRMTINAVPTVHFDIGNNFTNYKAAGVDAAKDQYLDIRVRPEVNPNNILTYLYSKPALDSNNQVQYVIYEESPTAGDNQKLYQDQYENAGLPDLTEIPTGEDIANNLVYEGGVPTGLDPAFRDLVDEQLSKVVKGQSADSDKDGCINSWDAFKNDASDFADSVADSIQNTTSMFRCSGGGCLPIPYNYVFFAPDGAVPGIATMAFGVPNPIGFAPFYPSVAPSTTRFYINPTLTMGLGTSICMGAPQSGLCYAFAVPVSSLGLCPDFLGPINDAIAEAKNVFSDGDAGMSTVVADGGASTGSDAINLGGNYSGDAPFSAASSVNVRIPGFPSVITNWIDKQTDEIYGKLLDLPDFYFIYPDVKTLISDHALASANFSKMKSVNDFLNAINSLPLIQIEGREVTLKLPAISKDEIEKWKRQGALWITYHKQQLEYLNNFWQCDASEVRRTLCDKVTLKLGGFVHDVEKFMDKLDQIANLPMEILKWRNIEAKYATQLICYLDAIMQYTGGYINKQQKRIQSWMKAMEDAINTFKSWKLLLDVMAEYQESCDECKNDRFSKLGLILQLFMVIPDPPIIPLPKWPDIVFDISQIKAGIKIVWPDIVFLPEPVTLPSLPVINLPKLPEALPNFTVDLDSIDLDLPDWLMEFPTVVMPELPDLPPLPLPKLPDLPRPPKIPSLPNVVGKIATVLKGAFKILCLLKKGFVPVLESTLATEIETLTQPNINVVLPIIKNLGFQWPAIQYDYLEQIRINAKLNMGIDTDFIYDAAKNLTDKSNKKVEDLVEGINDYTDLPLQELLNGLINKGVEEAQGSIKETLDIDDANLGAFEGTLNEINSIVENFIAEKDISDGAENPAVHYLTASQELLQNDDPRLSRSLAQIEAGILKENLPLTSSIQQMAEIRDNLIAYTKNLQDSSRLLDSIEDYGEFVKVLAESDDGVSQFASAFSSDEAEISNKTVKISFFDEGYLRKRYVAAAIDQKEAFKQTTNSSIPTPKGFYVVVENKNENILNYTSELSKKVNNFFNDVDHDGDFDLIYSMGGDVYLKTNYKNIPEYEKGKVVIDVAKSAVSDFVPDGGTMVNGISVPYENNKKAEVSWMPKDRAGTKYEVIVRKSFRDSYDEAFAIHLVDDPKITLDIENGNYYVNVFAIDENGKRSLSSESVVISPQVCSDKDAPMPAANKTSFKVPIFGSLELDASGSFDTTGEIDEYYVELDGEETLWSDLFPAIDENGDGITANDKTNPRFNIGPFDEASDIGMHKAVLHIVDENLNSSAQEISIEVFVPKISLDESFARTKIASGKTDPVSSKMPFSLWRNRYIYRAVAEKLVLVPRLDKVSTSTINEDGKYYTKSNGEYEINDFELENMILVEDAEGKIVAEIDPETGNIGNLAASHSTIVDFAIAPVSPTSVSILDPSGEVLGSVYVIGDPNIDAKIHSDVSFDAENYRSFNGVNVSDQNVGDKFEFRYFGAFDKTYPGGIYLVKIDEDDKTVLIVDAAGNVLKLDERINLKQKPNKHAEDPLVILIEFDEEIIGEIYVSLLPGSHIVGPNDVPFVTPRAPSAKTFYHVKEELLSAKAKDYLTLKKKGIVDDLTDIEVKVNRAEFVKILLKMLCIIPRKEAYEAYRADEADGGFSDIDFKSPLPLFYPYVKEGALRGLIEGYKGETDANGLHPFKPENTISRAEAVKIILEAMEHKGIIDLSAITEGSPWYAPYMQIAQNLSPLLNKGEVLKNNFIVTKEEAMAPNKELTRGELLEISLRVLEIYNCFEFDKDNDGMSDFCEEKYAIDDPLADPDNDGLKNIDECYYNLDPNNPDSDGGLSRDGAEIDFGTDPFNPNDDPLDTDNDGLTDAAEIFIHKTDLNDPDTDDGGVSDGQEVKNLTNPLFGEDDGQKKEYQEGEPGIYIVPAECNACPCASTFLNKAEVLAGDIFFTVISTFDESYILSKSNDVVIE
ncbi:VCBS repeat-containing protein [Candidatus Peregrinibacteria bacterium]|nr:VCBS repeat-containing protein [Candidatus Peregrinibacteria bacterium]